MLDPHGRTAAQTVAPAVSALVDWNVRQAAFRQGRVYSPASPCRQRTPANRVSPGGTFSLSGPAHPDGPNSPFVAEGKKLQITSVGRTPGLHIQTSGSILCDPWVNPAYFASWIPFPDNTNLD